MVTPHPVRPDQSWLWLQAMTRVSEALWRSEHRMMRRNLDSKSLDSHCLAHRMCRVSRRIVQPMGILGHAANDMQYPQSESQIKSVHPCVDSGDFVRLRQYCS